MLKNLLVLLFCGLHIMCEAQERLARLAMPESFFLHRSQIETVRIPNMDFLKTSLDGKFVSVASMDGAFHNTYFLTDNGVTTLRSTRPSSYFRPNDNLIIFSFSESYQRDSFNPYGATDISSMFILGSVNKIIGIIRKKNE
jgi:hypothetical protein